MTAQLAAAGVYRIPLAWSNVYLLTDGTGAALIDTGLRKDRPDLLAALREVGLSPERVRSVYLTHAHCDHAGNAAYFATGANQSGEAAAPPATVYTHRAEHPFIVRPRRTYVPRGWRKFRRPVTSLMFAGGEWVYPVERCDAAVLPPDGGTIAAPGGPLRVVPCPGHSPGHVAYFRERDGLLFSGDAILNIIPFKRVTGLSLPPGVFCDDIELTRRSALSLVELRPAVLLAGHGRPLAEDTAPRLVEWARTLG